MSSEFILQVLRGKNGVNDVFLNYKHCIFNNGVQGSEVHGSKVK
jgi:hypothetical protein